MLPLNDQPIGVIGLGLMGRPIAQNLLASGASLSIWNRSPEPLAELSAAGAKINNGISRKVGGKMCKEKSVN